MANTYYEVVGSIEGVIEILYGSFVRKDCCDEITAERESWKDEGYKKIKIVSRETEESPDPEVYPEEVFTAKELFETFGGNPDYEWDQEEMVKKALDEGFAIPVDGKKDLYIIDEDYQEGRH